MDGKSSKNAEEIYLKLAEFIDGNGESHVLDTKLEKFNHAPGVHVTVRPSYIIASFDDEMQKDDILEPLDIEEPGIYIPKEYLEEFNIKDISGSKIKVNITVPIATGTNISLAEETGEDPIKFAWPYEAQIELNLPVKGIKTTNDVHFLNGDTRHTFYMDYRDMETIMHNTREEYQESLENYSLIKSNKKYPIISNDWQSSDYVLYFEEGSDINTLKEAIQDIDEHYTVTGANKEINPSYQVTDATVNNYYLLTIGVATLTIAFVLIVKMYFKLYRRKEELTIQQINGIDISKLYIKTLAFESVFETILTFLITNIIINDINLNYQAGLDITDLFIWWTPTGVGLVILFNLIIFGLGTLCCLYVKRKSEKK